MNHALGKVEHARQPRNSSELEGFHKKEWVDKVLKQELKFIAMSKKHAHYTD